MKAYCCECGRQVPLETVGGKLVAGNCSHHPSALRFTENYFQKKFAEIYAALDAIKESPGRVYRGGATYWSVMEARAAKGGAL